MRISDWSSDVCSSDLALANRAGVRAVPAKQILVLTEDQMDAASGTIEIPDNAITRRLSKNLKQAAAELEITASAEPAEIDREQLEEQLFNAMDEVPEGWMVRSNRCGSDRKSTRLNSSH